MSCMLPWIVVHHVSYLPCSVSLLSQVINNFVFMRYYGQYAAPLACMVLIPYWLHALGSPLLLSQPSSVGSSPSFLSM